MGSPPPKKKLKKTRVKPKISISTSRQPRKLKFSMQAYFNQPRRNMNEKIGVTWPPSPPTKIKEKIGLILKLAVLCNPESIQLSLSQAKADPSIAWARFTQWLSDPGPVFICIGKFLFCSWVWGRNTYGVCFSLQTRCYCLCSAQENCLLRDPE